MFWRTKPPLTPEDEAWQIECWAWFLEHFGGLEALEDTELVLPNADYFPPSEAEGHERVVHVFETVAGLMGMRSDDFELIAQGPSVDPRLGPLAIVQNAPGTPAGTFRIDPNSMPTVTYDPALVTRPMELVAVLAHELCHYALLIPPEAPPGDEEAEEFATDLAVVHFGFGLFGANASFVFENHLDHGSGTGGWSVRRLGYLSEAEWGFAIALFLELSGREAATALAHLRDGPAGALKQALKYLRKHTDLLNALTAA